MVIETRVLIEHIQFWFADHFD